MTPVDLRGVSDARVLVDDSAPVGPQRATARFMRGHPAHWVALGFGSGLSPWAPGTVGTLWAWASFLLLDLWLDAAGWGVVIGASFALGVWACRRTAEHLSVADPAAIVWDEVLAFWTVLWLLMPASLAEQAVAFLLFRGFDVWKPGPIRWIDLSFKSAPGWWHGFGILADDLAAALATLLAIALWRFAWPG